MSQRAAARRLPWCWSCGSVGAPCGNRLPSRCGDDAVDASRRRIDAIDALSDRFPRRWDTAAEGARGKKARQETLKRVLKNAKTFVRDLSSEVLRAKELWAEDDFAADAELVYAAHTLHRLNELKVVAEAEQERGLEAKRKLIREAKRFQGVWCRACRHKCMDQQATHCPTCGVRFTSKGVIAVGDIGSENFREQTRESRASLADSLAKSAGSRPGLAELIEAEPEVQPQPSVTFSLETDESTNPLQRASIESSYTYGSESASVDQE